MKIPRWLTNVLLFLFWFVVFFAVGVFTVIGALMVLKTSGVSVEP